MNYQRKLFRCVEALDEKKREKKYNLHLSLFQRLNRKWKGILLRLILMFKWVQRMSKISSPQSVTTYGKFFVRCWWRALVRRRYVLNLDTCVQKQQTKSLFFVRRRFKAWPDPWLCSRTRKWTFRKASIMTKSFNSKRMLKDNHYTLKSVL